MVLTEIQETLLARADRWCESIRDRQRTREYYRPTFTILIAVGDSNWDYYTDGKGRVAALAKPGNTAHDSQFGDVAYFKGHMTRGYHGEQLTEAGRALVGEHYAGFWSPADPIAV